MRTTFLTLATLTTIACGSLDAVDNERIGTDEVAVARLTPAQAALALQAANQLDLATLDSVLDVRAATNIVAGRPFADLDALDAVPYVGPRALELLGELGESFFGSIPTGFEEIPRETLVLWAANELSLETLDDTVGLDRRAAEAIVADRPFASTAALDEAYYVGTGAMDDLEAYGRLVFGSLCEHGTVLGADGTTHLSLSSALDGASGRLDLIACRGAVGNGGGAWIEDEVHVALYGFGDVETEVDGYDTDAFLRSFDYRSSFTFYGMAWYRGRGTTSPLALYGAETTVLASTFIGNHGSTGGALLTSELVAIDSAFLANSASNAGGALSVFDLHLQDTDFEDNVVEGGEGGAIEALRSLEMRGGHVVRNQGASIVAFHPWVDAGISSEARFEGVDFGTDWANDGFGMRVITDETTFTYAFEEQVDVVCDVEGCH